MKQVTAALLLKEGKILIAQRAANDISSANLWEFPGGKLEIGETPEACLIREMQEELGIEISVDGFFMESLYSYDQGTIQLLAYWSTLKSGTVTLNVHQNITWVDRHSMVQYRYAPADIPIVRRLVQTGFSRE